MRFLIVYSVLVAFSFLSLTPAGVSLAELRADDDLELDELDLGLEEDEEESGGKKAESEESSEDEEDEDAKDSEKDEEESEEKSSEDSEDEEDEEEASSKSSAKEEDEEETYVATGRKIAAFYFFEDSHTLKSASHVAAETARQLESSDDYDYVGTEASLFTDSGAADVVKRAKKDFEAGVALYAEDNYEEAVEKFQTALKYFEDNPDKIVDTKLLSEIIFYLGASQTLLDEDKQAEKYFSTYISMNPENKPDESKFSSEVVSAFNSVKKARSRAFKGAVRVSSNPDGALVFIDGKIAGVTPVILRGITDGKHYYRIHKNGYRDAGGTVEVQGGRSASISETISKYSEASSMFESEKEMKAEFGQVSMLSESVDIAKELGLDNVLVVNMKMGANEKLTYTGYMVNMTKREYKRTEATFDVPEKGKEGSSSALKEFNNSLINDPYEYKSISDAFAAEVALIASDGGNEADAAKDKKDKEKKPVYKEWWLWTVVGVVVLAGAGVGTYFALTAGKSGGDDGGTLKINFE